MSSKEFTYLDQLKLKRKSLLNRIRELEDELYSDVKPTDEFFTKREQLNQHKIDLMTVKSKIKNYNKNYGQIESTYINNQLNLKR